MANVFNAEVDTASMAGPHNHSHPPCSTSRRHSGSPSCLSCLQNRATCDGRSPCDVCSAARKACTFPPPDQVPHQSQGSKNQRSVRRALERRLFELESLVERLSERAAVNSASGRAQEYIDDHVSNQPWSSSSDFYPATAEQEPTPQSTFKAKAGLQKGRSEPPAKPPPLTLYDELGPALHTADQSLDDQPEYSAPRQFLPGNAPISAYRSTYVDFQQLQPLPSQRNVMWHFYLLNVEPLIKILHVPTMEKLVNQGSMGIVETDAANEAILFAIYYAAVTSMDEKTVQMYFVADKSQLLTQYRFATEQSLAKANFLACTDIGPLQALVIFITVARRNEEPRVCWALGGMAVRIANGLRIHYDGTQLGLSPFDTEMRRRLWWAICALDLHFVEELGTEPTIISGSFSTEFPSNIDDTDIDPETELTPPAREGLSDCTIVRVRYEVCILLQKRLTMGLDLQSKSSVDAASISADWEGLLTEVYERLEDKFLKHCWNHPSPLYQTVAVSARVIMMKSYLLLYQPQMGKNCDLPVHIRNRLVDSAIQIIERHNMVVSSPRFQNWQWLLQIHVQWHAIALVLLETLRRPWDATSERGWKAVNNMLAESKDADLPKAIGGAGVWGLLHKLLKQVRKHRGSGAVIQDGDREVASHSATEEHCDLTNFTSIPQTDRNELSTGTALTLEQEAEFVDIMMTSFGNPNDLWSCINDAERMFARGSASMDRD